MEMTGFSIEKIIASIPWDDVRTLRFLHSLELSVERLASCLYRFLFPISKPIRKRCDRKTVAAICCTSFVESALGNDVSVALDIAVCTV